MAKTIVTLLDAITDKECKAYTSAVVANPREIFDAHTITIDEFEYKTLVETKQGSFNFRNINGVAKTTLPEYDIRRFECSVGNPHLDIDMPLWDLAQNMTGKAGNMIARQKASIINGVYEKLGQVFYYGKTVDSKGVDGLNSIVTKELTFNGGGNTANSQSSIWLISWGELDVSVVYGGGVGKNFSWSEFQDRLVQTSNGEATHKWAYLRMYPMVVVARPNCVARICNVESITDAKLYKVLAECEENGFVPDCIYMRPTILETLRAARTATNPTGAAAPIPEEVCGGIPVHTTLSISKAEAVVAGGSCNGLSLS